MFALRKAFDQLADSVMEETEKIRRDVVDELRSTTNSTFSSIEKLQNHQHRSEEERQSALNKTQTVLNEVKNHIEKLYEKTD